MTEPHTPSDSPSHPYLEHYSEAGGVCHCIPLDPLPFHIGRTAGAQYFLSSPQVSKAHTVIFRKGAGFQIRDLGSTNGTFLNGKRIGEAALRDGDIVHVADTELRFVYLPEGACPGDKAAVTLPGRQKSPTSRIEGSRYLQELLAGRQVAVLFQPIIQLQTRDLLGLEALGRGKHPRLSSSPLELFALAEHCRQAVPLSRLFRLAAVQQARHLPAGALLFLNLHPAELLEDSLIDTLQESLAATPDRRVVLEVHEDSAADPALLCRLLDRAHAANIALAYDDFGAGQARLTQLTDAPPDFIKLDRKLIRGIDRARPRQQLVRALARVSRDLGVRLIAEGIETTAEAATCRELGCDFGQGYLFAQPA